MPEEALSEYKEAYRTYAEMEADISTKNLKRWREKLEKNMRCFHSSRKFGAKPQPLKEINKNMPDYV